MATMATSQASLTARRLGYSRSSLSHQEEPVDLGDLWCPKNGFVAPRYYLVGRLNTARAMAFDVFRMLFGTCGVCPPRSKSNKEAIASSSEFCSVRVCLTLSLDEPVKMQRRIRVSPIDVLEIDVRYERLVDRYCECSMLIHGGLPCPRE
ncbi:hypothetical protein ACLB2K_023403 [Fragaria x ananassa]